MENQHRLIKGYRELTEEEVNRMNIIKGYGESMRGLLETTGALAGVDQRWVSIARTHFQEGFMALVRAVARPESF